MPATDHSDPSSSTGNDPAGVLPVVARAWPLLASVLLLMVGSGLQGSLLGVRAEAEGFDPRLTGAVLSVYYVGYVAGSAWVPPLVRRVGHIRVFAALTSITSAAVVIHGVWVLPVPWGLLRFTTGLCVAGLFLVSESWLHDVSTSATRGTLLALYNTVVTIGLALGSLLLNTADTGGFVLFVVASVVLSLAAVPVALSPHDAPLPPAAARASTLDVFRVAPLGLVGAAVSGFGTGVALGFGAVYASQAGFGVRGVSQFIASVLVGGVVGQVPLGRWSDRTDRRRVMGVAGALVAAGSGIGLAATDASSLPLALVAGAFIGAGAFSLYGLSFAHLADYAEPGVMAAAGAQIIRVNGLGAACGPFLAAACLAAFGPEGFFGLLGVVVLPFVLLVLVRVVQRAAVSDSRRASYTPMATSATVGVLEEVAAEAVGVEPSELRRRARRLRDAVRPR